jgi:CheY-like chemotaxis protein
MAKKILVVDDNQDIVEILKSRLEHAGFEVVCAYGGQEAIDSVQANRPDLVILDISMPGMDGYQTGVAIKNIANIPIIISSAKAQKEDVFRALQEINPAAYIVKPFDPRALIEAVNKALTFLDKKPTNN